MRKFTTVLLLVFLAMPIGSAKAEEKNEKPAGGPPPMLVATATVATGTATPTTVFVGTLYFARTARLAAEFDGLVSHTHCDEGRIIRRGEPLVKFDDALLKTDIAANRASLEQSRLDFKQAQKDFARIAALYEQASVATAEHEAANTRMLGLEKQTAALESREQRLQIELTKRTVRAPFDGMIVECLTEQGEWVKAGGTVATVADHNNLEVLADIPAHLIPHLSAKHATPVQVAGRELSARFLSVVPKGDIATRTFSARFGMTASHGLIEGMEARVTLAVATPTESRVVPRDALVKNQGRDVIFIIDSGKARMVPVEVTGHDGLLVGVRAEGVDAGQRVIVKGNERIRDGQAVRTGE